MSSDQSMVMGHRVRSRPDLRLWLEGARDRLHRRALIGSDPVQVLHRYDSPLDREIVGLVAACLAYGEPRASLSAIETVLRRLDPSPRYRLGATSFIGLRRTFKDFRYRGTGPTEMAGLLFGAKRLIERDGSLKRSFRRQIHPNAKTLMPTLGLWVDDLCAASGRSLDSLMPHPNRGSPCKRLNLYLRWMVRRDGIDPGGWDGLHRFRLVVSMNAHMHRVAVKLGLTQRRQPNLKTALEITDALRAIRPDDPLRYDFALSRPGITQFIAQTGSERQCASAPRTITPIVATDTG